MQKLKNLNSFGHTGSIWKGMKLLSVTGKEANLAMRTGEGSDATAMGGHSWSALAAVYIEVSY